jgi:hypothetical protein
VLQATIPLFETSGHIGYNDPAGWSLMDGFMQAQGQLTKAVPATQAYNNSYLPG